MATAARRLEMIGLDGMTDTERAAYERALRDVERVSAHWDSWGGRSDKRDAHTVREAVYYARRGFVCGDATHEDCRTVLAELMAAPPPPPAAGREEG